MTFHLKRLIFSKNGRTLYECFLLILSIIILAQSFST